MNVLCVICIDFEPGIPGPEVAAMVAKTLRLPLLDREITAGAARKLGLSECSVAMLEHEPDQPIERWILAAAEGDQAIGLSARTSVRSDPALQSRRPLMHAVREVIQEVTAPCVIANHEAAYALCSRPEALRVFLYADRAQREQWLREGPPARSASQDRTVEELDRAKRTYVRQSYGRGWPDLHLYDLTLDIGRLTPEQAAFLVSEYVRSIRTGGSLAE